MTSILFQPLPGTVAERRLAAPVAPVPCAERRRRPPDRRLLRVRAGRAAAQVPPLPVHRRHDDHAPAEQRPRVGRQDRRNHEAPAQGA